MAKLGDFLKAVNSTKENLMDDDPFVEGEYLPFVVNRTLSYYVDCIADSQEMNLRPHADNKLQFDYLLNNIRPKKRFTRWIKPEKEENILAIKKFYGYNNQRASEVVDILTDDQLLIIHERLNEGGLKNDKSERAG